MADIFAPVQDAAQGGFEIVLEDGGLSISVLQFLQEDVVYCYRNGSTSPSLHCDISILRAQPLRSPARPPSSDCMQGGTDAAGNVQLQCTSAEYLFAHDHASADLEVISKLDHDGCGGERAAKAIPSKQPSQCGRSSLLRPLLSVAL
jgi:hypothetical protein